MPNRLTIRQENGVVSIIVSVIIMIVLTLIAVAFAQIMRREQEQALDRQLSSQAFYAAETAINDAAFALGQDASAIPNTNGECDDSSAPLSQNVIDADLGIEYACVAIDSTPVELRYDTISTKDSTQVNIVPIDDAEDKRQLRDLTFKWSDVDGNGRASTAGGVFELPQIANWGDQPGMLRLEITPVANVVGRDSRDELISRRKVFFLYPATNGVTDFSYSATASGEVVASNCSVGIDTDCEITLEDIPVNGGGDINMYYVLRMKAVYDEVEMTITGNLVGGGTANFLGAQTEIDATGRAGDVLRRISARVANARVYPIPEFGLQGFNGVCKQLELVDNSNVSYNCYP